MAKTTKATRVPGGDVPPPNPKSQELLDAVNALAYGVTSLADSMPELIERMEIVSQQFAVLIASEAERRKTSADNLVKNMLMGLGSKIFDPHG